MANRLGHDIDQGQIKRIFEIMSQETKIFEGYTAEDMDEITSIFKILQYKK